MKKPMLFSSKNPLFKGHNGQAVLFTLLFFVLICPFALNYLFHHPDEKHYSNAAIQMLQNGDFFTPYYPDGSPRFLKPIFTYWTILLSYLTFGINQFSTRLPFLLAGTSLLPIIYRQVVIIFKDKNIAFKSILILAANPLYIMSTARGIPDIWLCVFLTLSALGMIRLLTNSGDTSNSLMLTYLGIAFAVATKGLPALAFGGAGLLFLVLNPWQRVSIKKILHPFWIPLALFIAFGWYFLMYKIHGQEMLDAFFNDQVGGRFGKSIGHYFIDFLQAVAFLLVYFIPWIFLARKNSSSNTQEKAQILRFILLWVVMTVIFCAFVFKFYDRYLLQIIPLSSIALAFYINSEKQEKWIKKVASSMNMVLILVGTISLISAYIFRVNSVHWLTTGIFTIGIILFSLKSKKRLPQITLSILLIFTGIYLALAPISLPEQGTQIANSLNNLKIKEAAIINNPKMGSKIRVASGLGLNLADWPQKNSSTTLPYIINLKELTLAESKLKTTPLSYSWKDINITECIEAIKKGNWAEFDKYYSVEYLLVRE